MPDNYTPVDTLHPTITVPIDIDTPNAASVSTPLEQLADNIVFTQSGWIPTSGGSLTGVLAMETGGFIEDENGNTQAGYVCLVQAASGHRKLISEIACGPDISGAVVFLRVYSTGDGSTAQIEETINAAWNDSAATWGYDTSSAPASRRTLSNVGESVEGYNGSTGWADGSWVQRQIAPAYGTNAGGLHAEARGSGIGLQGDGGTTGRGGFFNGGTTSGSGAVAQANGGNSVGLEAYGFGTGQGIYAEGGATGPGVAAFGGGSEPGVATTGGATGSGIVATGGSSSGYGVLAAGTGGRAGVEGTSDSGPGIEGLANSTGPGVLGQTSASGSPGVQATSTAAAAACYATATGSGAALTGDSSLGTGAALTLNVNTVFAAMNIGRITTAQKNAITGNDGDIVMVSTNSGGHIANVLWIWTDIGSGSGWHFLNVT